MLNDDLEKTQQERMDLFYAYFKKHKEDGVLESSYKDIAAEAERLDIKEKAPLILYELLLDDNAVQQINTHRLLFLRFTHQNPKSQKYLLGGVEQVVKMHKDALMARVPHLLKALYDADIMEEDVLIDWSKKASKKYVSKEIAQEIHEKAQPFIKWLKEAEEEESSGSEEETGRPKRGKVERKVISGWVGPPHNKAPTPFLSTHPCLNPSSCKSDR